MSSLGDALQPPCGRCGAAWTSDHDCHMTVTRKVVPDDLERCTAAVFADGSELHCERVMGHFGSHVATADNLAIGWKGDLQRLGDEADRATTGPYCCEICRRKERE